MAIAILGGLTTATFLNLVVLPEALIRMQRWLGLGKDGGTSHKPYKATTPAMALGKR